MKRIALALVTITTVFCMSACSDSSNVEDKSIITGVANNSSSSSSDISYGGYNSDLPLAGKPTDNEYESDSNDETTDISDTDDMENNNDGADDIESNTAGNNAESNETEDNIVLAEDKLVYKCDITVETLDFDESYSKLQSLMKKYNCIIASETFGDDNASYMSSSYYTTDTYKTGRVDTVVIRVPSKNYKDFISEYGDLGNIISKNQTIDNITQQYYDTTSQVNGLKEEMKRLEGMLSEASDISDMITINKEITDLQSQINRLTTQIRTMDADVAYSYVTLDLKEVVEYTDVKDPVKHNTFLDRLKNQFKDTWKGFLEFLEGLLFTVISLLPAIVILGVIYIIVRITCKDKIRAWKENRKQQKEMINNLLKYDANKDSKVDANGREHDDKKEI